MQPDSHKEFLRLYEPNHSRFVKYCSSISYGKMETQDLVQETILVVLQRWNEIRKKESLMAFMIGVAGKIVLSRYRKSWRETRLELESTALRNLEARTQNPETAFDIHLLYKAMDQLGESEKDCLILF